LNRLMALAAVASATMVVTMPTKAAPPPSNPPPKATLAPLDTARTPTADPKVYGESTKLAVHRCCPGTGSQKKGEIAAPPPSSPAPDAAVAGLSSKACPNA